MRRPDIEVGALLHGSWGYDQTNAEFFQVVARLGTTTLVIQKIEGLLVEPLRGGGMSGKVTPVKDSFVDTVQTGVRIRPDGRIPVYLFGGNTPTCFLELTKEGREHYSSWYA
jgi:queuine/archaeosine tRNA-ribosyltransferase